MPPHRVRVDAPPDPADIASRLDALARTLQDPADRQLLHWAARYILAGLELAREVWAQRNPEEDS